MEIATQLLQVFLGRKRTIQAITSDELRRERLGLDNEERRLKKDIDRIREDDRKLMSEYGEAKRAGDAPQMKFIARRVEEFRDQLKSLDRRHAFLTKQMRILNGLVLIKENEHFLRRVGSTALNMDLTELQMYVEEATSSGELNQERFDNLLQTMSDSSGHASAGQDQALEAFMHTLDTEVDGEIAGGAGTGSVSGGLDSALASLDREIQAAGRSAAHVQKATH